MRISISVALTEWQAYDNLDLDPEVAGSLVRRNECWTDDLLCPGNFWRRQGGRTEGSARSSEHVVF